MLRAVYYALLYRRRAARRAVLGREFIKGTIPTSHESRYPLFLSLSLSLSLSNYFLLLLLLLLQCGGNFILVTKGVG
jgi:hypothetical protein